MFWLRKLLSRTTVRPLVGVALAATFIAAQGAAHAQQVAPRPAKPIVRLHISDDEPVRQPEPLPVPAERERPSRESLSLEDLVAIAEQHSPALGQAAAEIDMARGRTRQAGLYPNPTLQGGGMQIGGVESQYFAQLSQEIVTRHKRLLNRAAADRQTTQAELRFVSARFALLTQVRKGYASVAAADRRTAVLTKLVKLARKSQQTATRLVESGEGARPDAIFFEIELEKAEVALENSEVAAAGARRQLTAMMGVRELQLQRLEGDLATSFERLVELVVIDDYVPQNANVLAAEVDVERSRLVARRAEVEPFPNVTVNAGYMRQLQGVENMALLNLAVPLPVWDRNQGNICAARADVGRALENVRQSQNDVARQMAEAIARFRAARQQVERYEQRIMPRAAEGVRIIQLGFDNSQFDFQRLLQAQRQLVESELGYVDALTEQWNAAAELAGLAQVEVFP